MPAGQELKSLRNRRHITVRAVEQASRRIADVKGDKRFCISNGWLAQLENGASELSIRKLFSLSVIYRVNFLDLVRLYVDVDDQHKYERVAEPFVTQLISGNGNNTAGPLAAIFASSAQLSTNLLPESEAMKVSQLPENSAPNIVYGQLGLSDVTMHPMIRPGALLKIDTRQNKLASGAWRNEYERPIFFIELREAYACGWCDLQGNQLLIIPHPLSPVRVRRFTHPREAEIVGRVVGYCTHCLECESHSVELPKTKAR